MAASTDEARPVLTGVLVQVQGGSLTLAATDGHRLAVRKLAASGATDLEASLIVPARALAELSRVLKGEPGKVEIIHLEGPQPVFFRAGTSELTSRLNRREVSQLRTGYPQQELDQGAGVDQRAHADRPRRRLSPVTAPT